METNAGDDYEVTADELFTTEIELDLDLNGDGIVGALQASPTTTNDLDLGEVTEPDDADPIELPGIDEVGSVTVPGL